MLSWRLKGTTRMEKTTLIHTENWPIFVRSLERLNKVARKLEQPMIEVKVLQTEEHRKTIGQIVYVDHYFLTHISGLDPKIKGWQVLGKIEHDAEIGNVVKAYAEMPEIYRTSTPDCDHCHKPRARKITVILRNETGETKQVGKSCLKDFTGHLPIDTIVDWAENIHYLVENDSLDEYDWGGRARPCLIDAKTYLAWVVKIIHEAGWLSKTNAIGTGIATADAAWLRMIDASGKGPGDDEQAESAALLKIASDTLAAKSYLTDYENNLLVMTKKEVYQLGDLGLAASMIPFAKREHHRRIEIEKVRQTDAGAWIGEPGERLLIGKVTVVGVTERETDFGINYLYKFVDEAGNRLTWFSSTNQYLKAGDEATITKATIKNHSEWAGLKETIITRAKIETEK